VTPGVRAQYAGIIDNILAEADLESITRKSIRNGIQNKVGYDIAPHKDDIKALIEERFDIFNAKQNGESAAVPSVETVETNGVNGTAHSDQHSTSRSTTTPKREAESEELSDVIDAPPPKKKRKAGTDEDAVIAARLQAEEDRQARPTRGGTSRKAAPAKKKKTPKKKTATKVTASDDSDLDSTDGVKEVKERPNTGFHVRITT